MTDETTQVDARDKPRRGRSLFGAIVLVAVGFAFLFINLGMLSEPDWVTAARFWPLILIFIGLDVLVTQFRHPLGTLLSLAVGLAAVAVFGYLLFSGAQDIRLKVLGANRAVTALKEESFAVGAEGVETATVVLELGNYRTQVGALPSRTDDLISGTVQLYGELEVRPESNEDEVTVRVRESGQPLRWLDPTTWNTADAMWDVKLNRSIPLDLTLDAGNGPLSATLEEMQLREMSLDGGNGSTSVRLPDGNYDIGVNGGNGSTVLTLPDKGRQKMTIDGGNGSLRLALPSGMEARVEFDTGGGRVSVDERFRLVSGDRNEGVYETAGYASAGNRILIVVETGNGSLTISSTD